MDYQIFKEFTDDDYYKFLELFYKLFYHPEAVVEYSMINRTKSVRVADIVPIEALREQLEAARTVRFTPEEIAFFQGTRDFSKDIGKFKQYLEGYSLPEIEIRAVNGQYEIVSESADSILWETNVLAIVNELLNVYRMKKLGLNKEQVLNEAEKVLRSKISDLQKLPKGSVLEFGKRRRFSKDWQCREYEILLNEVPDIVTATSNVARSIESNTPWAGTHPHAGVMLEQGLAVPYGDKALRDSHNQFFTNWWALYPYPFHVGLVDTYGAAFWQDFSPENAKSARGFRWDSGPWEEFNRKAVDYCKLVGINPKQEIDAFYSDGLDPQTMLEIQAASGDIFRNCYYGWGTNGSNDMGKYKALGLSPISLVMKVTAVNGNHVGKLSANPEKATGDPKAVENLKRVFGYKSSEYLAEVPVY